MTEEIQTMERNHIAVADKVSMEVTDFFMSLVSFMALSINFKAVITSLKFSSAKGHGQVVAE